MYWCGNGLLDASLLCVIEGVGRVVFGQGCRVYWTFAFSIWLHDFVDEKRSVVNQFFFVTLLPTLRLEKILPFCLWRFPLRFWAWFWPTSSIVFLLAGGLGVTTLSDDGDDLFMVRQSGLVFWFHQSRAYYLREGLLCKSSWWTTFPKPFWWRNWVQNSKNLLVYWSANMGSPNIKFTKKQSIGEREDTKDCR